MGARGTRLRASAAIYLALLLIIPAVAQTAGLAPAIDNFGTVNEHYFRGAQPTGRAYADLAASGVGGAYPHLRGVAAVNWGLNGFSAGVRTYLVGGYKECGDSAGIMAGGGLCYDPKHVGERQVSAWNSWDLILGYMFKTSAGRTSLSMGATNLFDQRPPKVYNGFAATTDTYSYDLVLRQVYARIGQSF